MNNGSDVPFLPQPKPPGVDTWTHPPAGPAGPQMPQDPNNRQPSGRYYGSAFDRIGNHLSVSAPWAYGTQWTIPIIS